MWWGSCPAARRNRGIDACSYMRYIGEEREVCYTPLRGGVFFVKKY